MLSVILNKNTYAQNAPHFKYFMYVSKIFFVVKLCTKLIRLAHTLLAKEDFPEIFENFLSERGKHNKKNGCDPSEEGLLLPFLPVLLLKVCYYLVGWPFSYDSHRELHYS